MSKEQDDLLNMPMDDLPSVGTGEREKHPSIVNPYSIFEVSVAATVVEVTPNFDSALKAYDQSLRRQATEVRITQILNGARTVILFSPVVVHRNNPINSLGFKNRSDS